MAEPRARRQPQHTDAQRLTFPLQLVVLIVSSAMASGLSVWVSLSTLKSDVRDIRTRMELTATINAAEAKLLTDRWSQLQESVKGLEKEQRMQQLEMTSLREEILKLGVTPSRKVTP